jgi:4a-hydroxytetrahydrobiopterin dehydratase
MSFLLEKKCTPLPKGSPALSAQAIASLGIEVPEWKVIEGRKISREYRFKSYMDGARWVPLIGEIADSEDHHPDVHLLYRKVLIELWTHTVNGLSENDYIVAAKFDQAYDAWSGRR